LRCGKEDKYKDRSFAGRNKMVQRDGPELGGSRRDAALAKVARKIVGLAASPGDVTVKVCLAGRQPEREL
jgi:hypothetical protein